MLKRICSVIYILAFFVIVICVPMSAIMLIFKACAATPLSWLGCCVPLIVAIAFLPFFAITKAVLNDKEV